MKHKKTIIQISILAVFFILAYVYTVLGKKGPYESIVGFTQGTTYRITYENKDGKNFQPEIDSLLTRFDYSLSIYNPNSIISRFNRNETGTKADMKFETVFRKSYEVYKKTEGAFDITVGPIINALGFGSLDTIRTDSVLIDSLRAFIGMDKVTLQNHILIKQNEHIMLDVNAIAQGYSVDLVAAFLDGKKIKNYMVEIGGEVRAKGKNNSNQLWRIGIDKPVEGNMIPGADLQAIIRLKNRALATSGNYRKYFEKNGIKFVHTIDPKTGYPVVSNLLSATVVADDCITADAYATALMVFGIDKSIIFLNKNTFLDAFLIYSDETGKFKIFVTQGLKKFIE